MKPSVEATNMMSDLTKSFLSGNTTEVADVVTFIEAQWGLGVKLTPVQKFILRCFYGIELDCVSKTIDVPNMVNSEIIYSFTEQEFLNWLYDEGRCNTNVVQNKSFNELDLVIGRRGSKSTLAAFISCYELYKLVKKSDPSAYYGFPPDSDISILNVAPTDEQSCIVYENIIASVSRCPFLRDRMVNNTQVYFNLTTDSDVKSYSKKKRASLTCRAGGCSSNSLRGHNNIIVIMDEMAFFIDNGGRFSGDEVYKALTPSTASFHGDGKIICISSPYAKYGAFYDRFNKSFNEQDTTLMFKMYSAMVNPLNVHSDFLKAEYRRNKVAFNCEFGAEFSDSVTAWIEEPNEFKANVVDRPKPSRGVTGVEYFAGIDLGVKNDGTAVAVVHRDNKTKKIILDYADVWYSKSSDVWEIERSIYKECTKFSNVDLISIAAVAKEIAELNKWFPIKAGWFDHWHGYALLEQLHLLGLNQFTIETSSDNQSSKMYQLVKTLYQDKLLELFNHPVLVPELLSLEQEKRTKYKVIVRAPNKQGWHDDMCLPPETPIMVCGCPKKISECVEGDRVITHSGQYQKVLSVSKRADADEIVEVKITKFGKLRMTPNHPVYVIRDGMRQFVPAGDLQHKDKPIYIFDQTVNVPHPIHVKDVIQQRYCQKNNAGLCISDVVDEDGWIKYVNGRSNAILSTVQANKEFFRLMGYYLAEGSLGNHGISFAFHQDETEYHADVKTLVSGCFGLDKFCEVFCSNSLGYQIQFNSMMLRDFWSRITESGATNKTIPLWAMTAPLDLQAELVKGLWRGDGYEDSFQGYGIATTSYRLAYQIRDILLRLGIVSSVRKTGRRGKTVTFRDGRTYHFNADFYCISIQSLFDVMRFSDVIGQTLESEKLFSLKPTTETTIRGNEVYCSIRGISKISYNGLVYNLNVENDHSYTTAYAVVHNSDAYIRSVWCCYNAYSEQTESISAGPGDSILNSNTHPTRCSGPANVRAFQLKKIQSHGVNPRMSGQVRSRSLFKR